MDICLVNIDNSLNKSLKPTSVIGMLWLQTHFDNDQWEALSNNTVIISAHGNSLRALYKYLFKISDKDIISLEIPTGNPMIINFEKKLKIKEAYYLDKNRAMSLI